MLLIQSFELILLFCVLSEKAGSLNHILALSVGFLLRIFAISMVTIRIILYGGRWNGYVRTVIGEFIMVTQVNFVSKIVTTFWAIRTFQFIY